MSDKVLQLKLSYITGLRPVVLDELKRLNFKILDEAKDSVFIEFSEEIISKVKKLRSVSRAYLVLQNDTYHPTYISNHKSILGNLIDIVVKYDNFKTFKISCAGADSPEMRSIAKYIQDTYRIEERDEADLKIHIIKPEDIWEIGIQITPRPLSVRNYKVVNMSGAMDPTIAYAVNSFCNLDSAHSYLNVFSGSATLLIEAAQCYPDLEKLLGFDNNKKHLSLSIKNIKKAGLIKRVQVKEADIFDKPNFGTFDAIVSDLPFGMSISKNEDLEKLYTIFVQYCEGVLNNGGRLVIYTSEYELIEPILLKSRFKIIQSLQLKFITNVDAYLRPKIIVCEFK
ncbi:MAG: methyltransferase domain-containing protein [Chlamydiae bacterium]|nr:methyltransferase domain-containing protein [Chlamydiota bacterium]